MRIKVDQGLQKLEARLQKLPREFIDATAAGQANAAQDIMALAKSRAPFESGTLEASAYVADVQYSPNGASVEMGFGGDAAEYMVIQHETLEGPKWNHPGKYTKTKNLGRAAQGQSKFFESAVNDRAKQTARTIADAVATFLRTGRMPKVATGPITKRSPQ